MSQTSRRRWLGWLIRLAIAAAVLSVIGHVSTPSVSPLMCKVYG